MLSIKPPDGAWPAAVEDRPSSTTRRLEWCDGLIWNAEIQLRLDPASHIAHCWCSHSWVNKTKWNISKTRLGMLTTSFLDFQRNHLQEDWAWGMCAKRLFVYSFIDDKDITGYINLINNHFSFSPDHTDWQPSRGQGSNTRSFIPGPSALQFLR